MDDGSGGGSGCDEHEDMAPPTKLVEDVAMIGRPWNPEPAGRTWKSILTGKQFFFPLTRQWLV
jgi:hypothetical protein